MFVADEAPGIHRLCRAVTNMYLVEVEEGILVVDAGLPRMWTDLLTALSRLGRAPSDVVGVILTHAHFDHVGLAARIGRTWGVPVWVHHADETLAHHPYTYQRERSRVLFPLRHPRSLPVLGSMVLAGALRVKGVPDVVPVDVDAAVPGSPRLIETPGHTFGHVALHFPDRDAIVVGDALVTHDPYTGRTGPRVVPGAATANVPQARASLVALREVSAATVLPGHGEAWTGGLDDAVTLALRAG